MKALLAFALSLALLAPQACIADAQLPEGMIGLWGHSSLSCADPNDDGRAEVTRQGVAFAVSNYTFQRIATTAPNAVHAEALILEEGYEEASSGWIELVLTEPNKLLVTTSTGRAEYVRCSLGPVAP